MTTVTDSYGRTITVATNQDGEDVYTLAGVTITFPTGTALARAISTIEGMAPAGHVEPKVDFSFLEFMSLFSPTEQGAIMSSADPQIRLFCLMAAGAGKLQLTNAEVVGGINYLVTAGILTSGNAALILSGQPSA